MSDKPDSGSPASEYVVVPRVPTPGMLNAGNAAFRRYALLWMQGSPAVWDAMLAAAPAHPPAALPEPPVDDKTHPRFMAGYVAGLKDGRSLERYDHETAPPARPALPDGWLAEADKLMWALFNAMHRHFSACQDNRAAMPAALEETAALNAVWDHLKRAVP